MAATVTGVFKVIDKASAPMKRMRMEAEKLDKALMSTGDRFDEIGGAKHIKQLENTERSMRDLDRTTKQTSLDFDKHSKSTKKLSSESNNLAHKLGVLAGAFVGVQKIIGAIKLPALIVGVSVLAQGVAALAGGVVALLPKLTDLVGILGVAPAALVGVGLAAGAAKLAFSGMSAAIKGTKGAMAKLTPEARQFVREMKALKPLKKELQASTQKQLFPGLSEALGQLTAKAPVAAIKRLLGGMGKTLGGVAERAAGAFTEPKFLKDLTTIGQQGIRMMNQLGNSIINVVQALANVGVAAQPFTQWLGKLIEGWTVGWKEAAELGRATGSLEAKFKRTQRAIETFVDILKNLWETFKAIGHAARPLGDDLWKSADKATEKWKDFAQSIKGQKEIREWFDSLKGGLHAIFELVGGLAGAFAKLGKSGGLQRTAENLTGIIEPLQQLFEGMAEKWGPVLAETLSQLTRLLNNLFTQGSYQGILSVVEAFNLLLESLNKLLEVVPGLNQLLTGILGYVAVAKLVGKLRTIAVGWDLVAESAGAAAIAQGAAGTAAMAAPGLAAAGTASTVAGVETSALGEAATVGGATGIKGLMGKLGGVRGIARVAAPIAGFFGAMGAIDTARHVRGATQGEMLQGFFSGASGGIIHAPRSTEERLAGARESAQQTITDVLGGPGGEGTFGDLSLHQIRHKRGVIARKAKETIRAPVEQAQVPGSGGIVGAFEQSPLGGLISGSGGGENQEEQSAKFRVLSKQQEELARIEGNRSKLAGALSAKEFAEAWEVYAKHKGLAKAADLMLKPVADRMERFTRKQMPQALRVFSDSQLDMLQATKKNNPKFEEEYRHTAEVIENKFERLGIKVAVVNGEIFRGTKTNWEAIGLAMETPAEKAREEVSKDFTAIQEHAVGSLIAMGYTRGQAKNVVQEIEAGHPTKTGAAAATQAHHQGKAPVTKNNLKPNEGATGMRLGGKGRQDTVPLLMGMAAPGELVVNGFTEQDVNRDLTAMGKRTLGERVNRETRSHSDLYKGRMEIEGKHRRRFRRGGRAGGLESVPALATQMGLHAGEGPGEATPGVHVADSLHYQGLAYDVADGTQGPSPAKLAFRKVAERIYLGHGLNELFYDPYPYYIDEGGKVTGAIGGHSDHVHIGFFPGGLPGGGANSSVLAAGLGAGLRGGGARQAISLKAPGAKQGGLAGAFEGQASNMYAAGLQKKINAKIGARGSLVGGAGLTAGTGGTAVERAIAQVLFKHGANKIAAAGIIGNAYGESSLDPTAEGTGGGGLWGFTAGEISLANLKKAGGANWGDPGFQTRFMLQHGGQGLIPALNAAGSPEAAAALFMNEWEKPGIPRQDVREAGARTAYAHGYNKGGRLPSFAGWYGRGGSFMTNGPTVFGAGENGREKVTVSPAGGGRAKVNIGSITVHNHRPGDIAKQIKEEVGQALKEVGDEMNLDFGEEGVLA